MLNVQKAALLLGVSRTRWNLRPSLDKDKRQNGVYYIEPRLANHRLSLQQGAFLMPADVQVPFTEHLMPHVLIDQSRSDTKLSDRFRRAAVSRTTASIFKSPDQYYRSVRVFVPGKPVFLTNWPYS